MKELIQRLMIYVIIVSALKGLLTNKQYEEYFRFCSGMLMLLMFLFPVLSLFGSSTEWYQRLEKNLLQMDIREIQGTLKIADHGFENIVVKEYKEALEKEVVLSAKEEGISLKGTEVLLEKGDDGICIAEISAEMEEKTKGEGKTKEEETETDIRGETETAGEIAVQTIQIGEESDKEEKVEDDSKKGKKLKKKICERFSLSE
ncbi:MAG: stage III sporulation protein AF, partial [Lachnospiraceae bacterium]|nr:stage III sporulation protein AF [Lachnospiraceae bacterium]